MPFVWLIILKEKLKEFEEKQIHSICWSTEKHRGRPAGGMFILGCAD